VCAALLAVALLSSAALAEDPEVTARRATQRTSFTDAEIAEGFFKIAFGAELALAGSADRVRKFENPVRLFVDSRAEPDRRRALAAIVADIAAHIQHLDIAITEDRAAANLVVTLVLDRDLGRTIRAVFGRERGRRIQRSLEPQCLSGFHKDESYRITRAEVILVVDASDFIFYDCAYEELLQALGPINDDSSVPWTMFNDDNQMGFFDVYDQYLLNILYDPRLRAGMTPAEVRAILPAVLADTRAFVARVNGLPH
jgi:hypothetical protein